MVSDSSFPDLVLAVQAMTMLSSNLNVLCHFNVKYALAKVISNNVSFINEVLSPNINNNNFNIMN